MSNGTSCNANQEWTNWAGTLTSTPQCTFYPESEADLVAIVNQARQDGKKIRMVCSGHSWSPGAVTQEYLVNCNKMTQITPKVVDDPQNPGQKLNLLEVQPGSLQGKAALDALNFSPSLAFPTLGVVPSITLGGFIANGCHGTGWDQPTVSDLVYAMRIVKADGTVASFSEAETPDQMDLVRANLGALGIISSITFKMVPNFNLAVVDETQPMDQVVKKGDPGVLESLITSHPYVELFWFPFNTDVWVKYYDYTDQPPSRGPIEHIWDQIFQFLSTEIGGVILNQLSKHPEYTPEVMKLLFKFAPTHNNYVASAAGAFLYQSVTFPVVDFSFAVPIPGGTDFSAATEAWYQVVDGVNAQAAKGNFPVNVSLHARFIKNSQALLSPAYEPAGSDTHYCFIEFLSFQPQEQPLGEQRLQDFIDFGNVIGPQWMGLEGRPHWAKLFQDVPGIFPYVYQQYGGGQPGGNLETFKAFQQQMDPGGMFINSFLEQIFSGGQG